MESLPSYLIMEILSRVPTLELGNLRCVCREWRDIVRGKDPLFRTFHLSHSISKPADNTLVLLKGFRDGLSFVDLVPSHCHGGEVTIQATRAPCVDDDDVFPFWDYVIIGSCNGLLCLGSKERAEILVMNPITSQRVRLELDKEFSPFVWSWGFGFDSVKKVYKVLAVAWGRLPGGLELRVCDLDSEGRLQWRDIVCEDAFPFDLSSDTPACFFNGRLHWPKSRHGSVSIVSFDLADEEFRLIPLPDGLYNSKAFHLFESRGCLCIVCSEPSSSIIQRLEIWVMKQYGVKESWVKEVDTDTPPLVRRGLPFCCDEEFLTFEGLGSIRDGKVLLKCKSENYEEAILFSSDPTCHQFQFLESGGRESVIHTASLNWI